MKYKPTYRSYVLLKDGTMIDCSSEQKNQLGMAILMATDLSKKRIKLGGRIFTLDEIESDPEKIYKSQQQSLPLPGTETAPRRNMA